MKVKCLVIVVALLCFAGPALAAGDTWLRSQVRSELTPKIEKNSSRIDELARQNKDLAAQVQDLMRRVQQLEQKEK